MAVIWALFSTLLGEKVVLDQPGVLGAVFRDDREIVVEQGAALPVCLNTVGEPAYPHARRLLITADSGGSKGSRLRLWKTEMAAFAGHADLRSTCCT